MDDFLQETSLKEKLVSYQASDYYPFHMPGHKRVPFDFPNPYTIDITEIEGFDNLHHATGILKDAQAHAADVFGSKETFYLVNGSTCGILSAISAAVPRGGTILMGRNCHKSAYHASYLMELKTIYLMPEVTDFGIMGSISPGQVHNMLTLHPEIQAVFLTSPTYDGVVSDIRGISLIAHEHNIPLIVDEAHGAHFVFSELFPDSSLRCGADLVIQSLHKTLPCFTQTALLHMNSERVPKAALKRFLDIYQTSSPSYLFMVSMEQCLLYLTGEDGLKQMQHFSGLIEYFYQSVESLQHLHVFSIDKNCFDRDPSKLLISVGTSGLTGQELYSLLLHKYHLQMEMVSGHYVVALTSLMDTIEGFERLSQALQEIDRVYTGSDSNFGAPAALGSNQLEEMRTPLNCQDLYTLPLQNLTISQALEKRSTRILLADSAGSISQEYIYLYPPGIPLLAPGELITRKLLRHIELCQKQGLSVEGLSDLSNTWIIVVKL